MRVLLLGNLRAGISGSVLGRAGLAEELVEFPFFFLLSNLPSCFTVPWVDGGLAAAWFHSYILIFCFLPVLIFYGLHLGYGYGGRGGNVSHFLLWFPGLLWRLHLLRTQPLISVFWGRWGSVGKAYLGLSGAGALQSVVVCWLSTTSGRSVIGSVRSGQGGRCFEATCLFESGCGISWVCGCPVGFRAPDFPGFPRLLALALAPGGSAAFFCMPRY